MTWPGQWRQYANCKGLGHLFFPLSGPGEDSQGTEAKRVCAECQVITPCLDYAVRTAQEFGIWGGVGKDRRDAVRRVWLSGNALAYHQALAGEINELARLVHGHDERPYTPARSCERCGDPIAAGRHPVDRNYSGATCGKASTYNKGCRCARCRHAKQARKARYAAGSNTMTGTETGATAPMATRVYDEPIPLDKLFEATGIRIDPKTSLEEWGKLGESLLHMQEAHQWWLGDWYVFGDEHFGEEATQYWDERYDLNTLENYRRVAAKIPKTRRRKNVPWSLHRLAAGLDDPKTQDEVLKRADKESLTYAEMRDLVNAHKLAEQEEETPRNGRRAGLTFTVSVKGPLTAQAALGKVTDQLETVANELLTEAGIEGRVEVHRPTKLKAVA